MLTLQAKQLFHKKEVVMPSSIFIESQSLPQPIKNIIRLFNVNPDEIKIGDDLYSKIAEKTGIERKEVKRKFIGFLYNYHE